MKLMKLPDWGNLCNTNYPTKTVLLDIVEKIPTMYCFRTNVEKKKQQKKTDLQSLVYMC